MSATTPWRIVSPAPAGVFDGIGDFSAMLTSALQPFGAAELFVRRESWAELDAFDAASTAGAVVQYLPQAFMRGDLRRLLRWLDRLRAAGKPVVLMVHEYWPPLDGTVRRAAVRLAFRHMLRACIRRSTVIVTSQEFSAHEMALQAQGRRVVAIPVGSSIPRIGERHRDGAGCRLVLFGQPAALHAPTMQAMGKWLSSAPSDVSLTWLGRSTDEMRAAWCDVWKLAANRVSFSGGLAPEAVSAILQSADLGLAPYENGASSRRTSFAALLQHRLPLVAVDGLYTSDWLRESQACVWTPEGQPPTFVAAVAELITDTTRQRSLSTRAGELFDSRLSWPCIGDAYARLLSEGVSA